MGIYMMVVIVSLYTSMERKHANQWPNMVALGQFGQRGTAINGRPYLL
jgi:hypothetical protein